MFFSDTYIIQDGIVQDYVDDRILTEPVVLGPISRYPEIYLPRINTTNIPSGKRLHNYGTSPCY